MIEFSPDYRHVENAARNIAAERTPLYEHIISEKVMETVLNTRFVELQRGNAADRRAYFRQYVRFFMETGYDTVSFERCIGTVMPGSGALGGHKPGIIKSRDDFNKYPWRDIPRLYFERYQSDFEMLSQALPPGMKAVGGPGNGVFECVQDLVGYMDLCYLSADDPELYRDLFDAVGGVMYEIWQRFLPMFADAFCVCRFGDDLGYKSGTLLPPDHIREYVVPQYQKIVSLVHAHGKPFLLHSCGQITDVMDALVEVARIDAKHSNEDQIAPFAYWVNTYGGRIGNFGGVDMDVLCRESETEIARYTRGVIADADGHGGFAIGSGNSIADYVPASGYLAMVETVRKQRGDYS